MDAVCTLLSRKVNPTPYTLHPTPYTLHPTPYTLHPTPFGESAPSFYSLHREAATFGEDSRFPRESEDL